MARARIGLALLSAVLFAGSTTWAPRVVIGGAGCDINVNIRGEVTDGGAEFYRRWSLILQGTGYPPSTALELRVLADGVLVHTEDALSEAGGTWTRDITFIGFLAEPYDHDTAFSVILLDPADPGGCSDVVDLVRRPDPPFGDIVFSRFLDEIIWAHDAGLFVGCRPGLFCGFNPVTRAEAAVVLVRAFGLPSTTDDFFADDDGHKYEWAVNRLAAAGLAVGCGPNAFCPGVLLTRAQAASVLVAALELPPSDVDRFADDDGSSHESAINALAAAGLTLGCSRFDPTRFCPDRFMTREQFAAFLFRALS